MMYNFNLLQWVAVCVLFHSSHPQHSASSLPHPPSPCPAAFSYEGAAPEADRWYGEIVINSREHLVGVRLSILLDRRIHLLVSWLGEVTSNDNKEFTILNLDERLDPYRPLTTRIMVRFNSTGGSPKVKTIYLNGKQICPGEPPIPVNPLKYNSSKPSGFSRPDPIFQTDTVYNPSVTTNDDYYSEFYNINQQNAHKRKPDMVYANTESSVAEGQGKPHKSGHNKGTDNAYLNSQNIDYSNQNREQGTSRPKKKTEEPEYVRPKPHSTYTEQEYARPQATDEYGNYNPRPQNPNSNIRPQNVDNNYNRPQSEVSYTRPSPVETYNNFDTRPQTSNTNSFGSGSNTNTYNSVSRPQENNNHKPQSGYDDSYRPQGNSDVYVPEHNSGSGHSGNKQPSNNGYSTNSNPNSRPLNNVGQNAQTQTGDITNIEKLIEDGDANKTVIITVIKHNPQDSTTEAYRTTTSSNKYKTTSKPNNNQQDNKNNGNAQGHPLNAQHNQRRPAESGSKKPSNNNNNNGQNSNPSNKNAQCGMVVNNKATPLVTNGQKTSRGQWPWHAALYKTEGINLSYICGGSLISPYYVITAAHCVTKRPYDKPVDSDTIVIYLGKYHQHQFSDEGGVQNKQVQKIHVYPTYNSSNYLGDVALLRLSSEVEYSTFVRPVCLWDDSSAPVQLSAVEGLEGTVIGWGYDENDRVSEELKMAIMPIVSHQQCLWSNPQFFSQFTSDETYCAGFRNGTSVCNGDSGGGMVFKMNSLWYLRGIVSITVARDGLRICDTKHYVVFTDVAKYLTWVRPIISGN